MTNVLTVIPLCLTDNFWQLLYLTFAELRAEQQLITTMNDWKNKLSNFLAISDYEVLKHSGTISNEEAQTKAFCEYEKFKLIQDREYLSDFDKELKRLKDKGLFNDEN